MTHDEFWMATNSQDFRVLYLRNADVPLRGWVTSYGAKSRFDKDTFHFNCPDYRYAGPYRYTDVIAVI